MHDAGKAPVYVRLGVLLGSSLQVRQLIVNGVPLTLAPIDQWDLVNVDRRPALERRAG